MALHSPEINGGRRVISILAERKSSTTSGANGDEGIRVEDVDLFENLHGVEIRKSIAQTTRP
jgi:hypothetical protein